MAFESASLSATGTLRQLTLRKANSAHCVRHELDDALDVANVARDLELERDVHASRRERLCGADRRARGARSRASAQKLCSARSRVSAIWNSVSSLVSSNSVLRSSLRLARRSSPPCSRIFFESETSTPRPELSM